MLEPLKNPANWDNFRKAAVLVLIIWATATAVLCIIYFFVWGGRSPAPADIFRALILLVPLSLRPIAGLAQVQEPGGGEAGRRKRIVAGRDLKHKARRSPSPCDAEGERDALDVRDLGQWECI